MKKLKKSTIIIGCLGLCFLCFIVGAIGVAFAPPSFSLKSSSNLETTEAKSRIEFSCTKISKVKINDKELSETEKGSLCSTGLGVDLNMGDNNFSFTAISEDGKQIDTVAVKIVRKEPTAITENNQPSEPQKQYKTVEEWVDVTSFSGSSSTKTNPFTIDGKRWKVIYSLSPQNDYQMFSAYVYKPGASLFSDTVTLFAKEGGETTLYSKGEFYLDITSANTGWAVTVQQLVEKQVEI